MVQNFSVNFQRSAKKLPTTFKTQFTAVNIEEEIDK